jgi:hypothetical protein
MVQLPLVKHGAHQGVTVSVWEQGFDGVADLHTIEDRALRE